MLHKIIDYWLEQKPPDKDERISICTHGIFDGTYLNKPTSIIALMNTKDNTIVESEYPVNENSRSQVKAFLLPLKEKGLSLQSVTVDGNPHVIRVFRELWPDIKIQRCLIHIQRQGTVWCRSEPRTKLARELRELLLGVTSIHTESEMEMFFEGILEWEEKYGEKVKNYPSNHKVLSDMKRARSMILKALPYMFSYLEDDSIPISTNSLEGYFSRLSMDHARHRGMSKARRTSFYNWYTYLNEK